MPDSELSWPDLRKKLLKAVDDAFEPREVVALRKRLYEYEFRSELLNYAGEIILILQTPSGQVLQANEFACRLIGHSHGELQAITLFHLLDSLEIEPIRAFLSQQPVMETQQIFAIDMLSRHGERIPMEMFISLVTCDNVIYAVAFARDAREHLRAFQLHRCGMDRIARLMNTIGDAAIAVDIHSRVIMANPLAREITGWEPAVALGRSFAEVFALLREDAGEPEQPMDLESVFNGQNRVFPGPLAIKVKNGGRRRVIANASPIENGEGAICGALIVFRDVAAMALRETVFDEIQHIPAGGPIVTFKWKNAEGMPLEGLSANAEFLFGCRREERAAGNIGLLDLVHPEDRNRVSMELDAYQHARVSGFELKFRVLRPDNTVRTVHAYMAAISSSAPTEYNGYLFDITALTVTETAFKESEQKYRSLVEASTNAILLTAYGGRILECNSAACRLFGYSRSQYAGLNISDLFAPESLKTFDSQLASMENQGSFFLCLSGRRRNGEIFPVEISMRRFQIKGSGHIVACLTDITARRKMEEEARLLQEQVNQAQKLESLGLLAGGIAHDFNNLLVGILGNADLALDEMAAGDPLRGYIEDVKKAGQYAAELVNQMLGYAGKSKLTGQSLDLRALVQDMMQLLRASISQKIKITTRFHSRLSLVRADAVQLRQVIMNLLTNAADAIGDKIGTVTISAEMVMAGPGFFTNAYVRQEQLEGAYVCLQISDTGQGMDAKTKERIFDPFFTTKNTGRGLGLSVLLGIVRAHRGAIKIDSEPGKGTTFSVFLPAVENILETSNGEESPALSAWRGHGCVLVVDDEPTVCAVARRMLERMGFNVLVATSGREAVGVFQREAAAVATVLLDMTMPDMDGEDVFREIIQIRPDVPVVLASGYAEDDIMARFRNDSRQPAGFVHKPYAVVNLKRVLEKVLQRIA